MMMMEASSNSRDGLLTSLQLSVEQWELLRRLRNSHLTKKQIIRAYDELDRLDRELGNLFNTAHPPTLPSSSVIVPTTDPVSPSTINSQQISPPSSVTNNKRSQSHTGNNLPSVRPTNGYHTQHSSSNPNLRPLKNGSNEPNSTVLNSYETINSTDLEEETRELQELLAYVDHCIE
jgi:hypothetical protein